MAENETMIDYVRWRGDLTFQEDPLNVIDNLILCELSYLDFQPIAESEKVDGKTLKECYQIIQVKRRYRLLTAVGGYEDFVAACAASKRFGDLVIDHFEEIIDPEKNIQFAAMHFCLDKRTDYVAFRGTDDTLVGWKEDFMMSFTPVPSQYKAKEYLRSTMTGNQKYYVGGHSKGANLAIYAAASLPSLKRRRLLHVFFNDGPGMSKDVKGLPSVEPILSIMTKVIPEFDLFGRLFEFPVDDLTIVKSTQKGIMQHDMTSWCLTGPHLSKAENTIPTSDYIASSFNKWVADLSQAERVAFVDELFDALSANGARNISQIREFGMEKVIQSMLSTSKMARNSAIALPKTMLEELGSTWENSLREMWAGIVTSKEPKLAGDAIGGKKKS